MSDMQQALSEQEHSRVRSTPLWRNRNFLVLVSGQGISSVGSQISLLAFPLLILAITHSPVQAGLMTALRGLPYALLCLPAGALVDRWDRKRVMVLSDIGRGLALGSIPLAWTFGHLTVMHIYLVSLIEGTLFVFFQMAETGAIPHVVPKEQLTSATGQNEVIYSSSLLVGPSIGGFLYSISSMLPFVGDAISYAVSVVSLCFVRASFQDGHATTTVTFKSILTDVQEGLSWLWHNPLIRFLAILTCGLTTPCIGYSLILIVIAQGQHASPAVIGLIFAGSGVGSIVGAMLTSPLLKRFGFSKLIIGISWLWAITWLFFAIAPNPLILGIVTAASFAVVPIFFVATYSYRLASIPDHLQGRVNSVFRLISFGSQPLGFALTGFLLQSIGPTLTVLVLFVPQFVLCIVATFNRALRHARPMEEL
jgi:MFS family permease